MCDQVKTDKDVDDVKTAVFRKGGAKESRGLNEDATGKNGK